MMHVFIRFLILFLVPLSLVSQNAGPIFPVKVARNDRIILICDNSGKLYRLNGDFAKNQTILLPKGSFNDFLNYPFFDGEKLGVSTVEWIEDGREGLVVNRFFEFVDKGWKKTFELISQKGKGYRLVFPLRSGDFLAIGEHLLRTSQGYESIFCVLRKDAQGTWVRHRSLDPGFSPQIFRFEGFPMHFQVAQVGDYLAVADPHPGYIWIFHQEDGRLKRLVKLYEDIDLKRLETNDFSSAMLGIQPTEDGLFMIAARPESTVLNDDFAQRLRSGVQGLEGYQEIQVGEDSAPLLADYAWKHHPEVVWMTLNPETGSLKGMNPPPKGAKTRIQSWLEAQTFHWIPTWNGEVFVGDVERAMSEARKREVKDCPNPEPKKNGKPSKQPVSLGQVSQDGGLEPRSTAAQTHVQGSQNAE